MNDAKQQREKGAQMSTKDIATAVEENLISFFRLREWSGRIFRDPYDENGTSACPVCHVPEEVTEVWVSVPGKYIEVGGRHRTSCWLGQSLAGYYEKKGAR